jgi:hypothetical protein
MATQRRPLRIVLRPPKPDAPSFEIDHLIVHALAALHRCLVKIRGAGRFGTRGAAILLQREDDSAVALAALREAGIDAETDETI